MRKYELMVIYNHEEIPIDEGKKFVHEQFTSNKIEVVEEQDMGQKELSFPIHEKKRGYYFLYIIQTEQTNLGEMESAFKINHSILRYLIIRQ